MNAVNAAPPSSGAAAATACDVAAVLQAMVQVQKTAVVQDEVPRATWSAEEHTLVLTYWSTSATSVGALAGCVNWAGHGAGSAHNRHPALSGAVATVVASERVLDNGQEVGIVALHVHLPNCHRTDDAVTAVLCCTTIARRMCEDAARSVQACVDAAECSAAAPQATPAA